MLLIKIPFIEGLLRETSFYFLIKTGDISHKLHLLLLPTEFAVNESKKIII